VPSGPCLCGLCFRGGQPRSRFSVILTPPIGRTHNEQVWYVSCRTPAPYAYRTGARPNLAPGDFREVPARESSLLGR
jgi:hypothetical protein